MDNQPKVESMRCTRCNQIKDASEFSPDPTRATGLYPHCLTCYAARRRQARENKRAAAEGREPRDMSQVPKYGRFATKEQAPKQRVQIRQTDVFQDEAHVYESAVLLPADVNVLVSPTDHSITVYSKQGQRLMTIEPEEDIEVEVS